ncbi:acyltransferase [Ravibacter arvi]|uniref:Acyltransferase n=1 Tax=Ravibacter arvi TaxID=2051041 RepID=A0ABP8LMT4_9BACT
MAQFYSGSPGKLEQVDVLRGIAILLVFGYHWHLTTAQGFLPVKGAFLAFENATIQQIAGTFSPLAYGDVGVQLFLVISGFLIHHGQLARGGELNIRKFFARRFWRIYPPYLLVLLFFAFVDKQQSAHFLFTEEGRVALVSHIFLVHNFFSDSGIIFGVNPSFWSIALEAQLYALYPLFLVLAARLGIRALCTALFFVHIAAILGIMYRNGGRPPERLSEMTFVLHYWIVWVLGAVVADFYSRGRRVFNVSWWKWLILLLTYAASKAFILFFFYFNHIMAAVLWAMLLELVLHSRLSAPGFWEYVRNALIYVGLCSYSIYLIHQPLIEPLLRYINWADSSRFTPVINGVITFVIIFLVSYGMYLFIEQPSIRFGQKLAKQQDLK